MSDDRNTDPTEQRTRPPSSTAAPLYPTGYGFSLACPECGEQLWVFVPTNGDAPTVMRDRDIPREDEGED